MKTHVAALAALLLISAATQAAGPQYVAVENWIKTPPNQDNLGPLHGDVAVASNGDVYVSVLKSPLGGIQVYDRNGNYLRNVSGAPEDFHGFVIHKESGGEFIYGARLFGGTVLKMQLDGKIVLEIPRSMIPEELIVKNKDDKQVLLLTAVDVAPDGRIVAVDGYSSDNIHVFDRQGKHLNSFGGKKAPYNFKTCHKIAIDTRYSPPRILCCDREGRRMLHLSMDGEVLGQPVPDMKRPAAVVVNGDLAAVAEIEGRISLLDKTGGTVATFGENPIKEQTATNEVAPADWKTGVLTAPHGIAFDGQGNLFVAEFNKYGRVLRFDLRK